MQLVIEHELPTLNKYIGAERTNKYLGAKIKREATDLVAWTCKGLAPITKPADYIFTWYRPDKRSDPDNIAFAAKFIFDGLVTSGKLPNDSMKWVRSIIHNFEVGAYKVTVDIQEL